MHEDSRGSYWDTRKMQKPIMSRSLGPKKLSAQEMLDSQVNSKQLLQNWNILIDEEKPSTTINTDVVDVYIVEHRKQAEKTTPVMTQQPSREADESANCSLLDEPEYLGFLDPLCSNIRDSLEEWLKGYEIPVNNPNADDY